MVVFDKGLTLGSCLGESTVVPLIILAIALVLARVKSWEIWRFGSVPGSPWAILGFGITIAVALGASNAARTITARIESADGRLAVSSCYGGSEQRATFALSAVTIRFVVAEAKRTGGSSTPLARFAEGEREITEIPLNTGAVDLGALAAIAPEAVSQYRRWQAP